jgi:hypothetical protein
MVVPFYIQDHTLPDQEGGGKVRWRMTGAKSAGSEALMRRKSEMKSKRNLKR